MSKYLDETGLAYFWGKLQTYIANAVKVTGVKGNAESSYRTGNINLTPANIGAATSNHTHPAATVSAAGLMSSTDKIKLDGLNRGVYAATTESD